MAERRWTTEARDVYGNRIRLGRNGLRYGEEFVSFDDMGAQPASYTFWNPATSLSEITVPRRRGPDLVLRNLSPETANRLGEAINEALRKHRA
ncbi:hypothetical protein GBA65_01510 [Rubrobacter marinus]|uniref:Uncharacterized protein n=1 Tax=Rubrobacter marinus TaxID=2653852 RepID=A0A6G8PSU9_9ACTN|nr:hypothetical protein [Rubrobacter marinus]QIN77403.1 hypothetical protein GBA65_01510 [Rubrobacter marinus]